MEFVELHNGVRMPAIGLGVFQVPPGARTQATVESALRRGYRLIDTAAYYSNEADVAIGFSDPYNYSWSWWDRREWGPIRQALHDARHSEGANQWLPAQLRANDFPSNYADGGFNPNSSLFMFGTGARISEALAMTWSDINLKSATALIRQTKINDERVAHLPPRVVAALANIPSNHDPDGSVFRYVHRTTARQVWNNAIKRAGIKQLSFHSCRHGFATTLLHRGVDVVTVAEKGGWKVVTEVVRTYGHSRTEKSVTDAIFDTNLTQPEKTKPTSNWKERKKQ